MLPAPPARAADAPGPKPAEKKAGTPAEKIQERIKWANRIVFFGEEDTGKWSLRVQDRDATERATVRYTELWKYDPGEKKWVKVDDHAVASGVVPAGEKPANSPPGTQLIAELPIKEGEVGLFYAKWRVNDDVEGATFCKLGPGLTGDAAKEAQKPMKVPPGMMSAVVPLGSGKAELQVIPDPRFNTGQATVDSPTSKPAAKPGR